MRIWGVLSSECCPPEEDFLFFCVIMCSFYKRFVLTNENLGCELSNGFRHFMSHKIQGVHVILIGPIGQFQSVTKGVPIVIQLLFATCAGNDKLSGLVKWIMGSNEGSRAAGGSKVQEIMAQHEAKQNKNCCVAFKWENKKIRVGRSVGHFFKMYY